MGEIVREAIDVLLYTYKLLSGCSTNILGERRIKNRERLASREGIWGWSTLLRRAAERVGCEEQHSANTEGRGKRVVR
jgi:hypothetical protein